MAISSIDRPRFSTSWLARRRQLGRRGRAARVAHPPTLFRLEDRTLLASNWTALTNQAPTEIQTMELLTNGDVMAASYDNNFESWYLLTPSATGSYVGGTWSQIASEPTGRLYTGSAVLPNGNYFVVGGEYINGSNTPNDGNTSDEYDPFTNAWTPEATFPQANFGDDPLMLLNNGNILAGYLAGPQTYLYNYNTNTWTQTGTKNNNDPTDEEGWTLLPDGSVLDYDVFVNTGSAPGLAQRYIPSTGKWVNTGIVPVALSETQSYELGPNTLLPNGKVIYIGDNGNSAIFDPSTDTNTGGGTWTEGPQVPGGYAADDAAGVLLPNGQFIFTADNFLFTQPTHVFDYNYVNNTITDITPAVASGDPSDLVAQLAGDPSFTDRFLMLPNGQALFTAGGDTQLYVYTGTGPVDAPSTPSISGITPNGGNSYTLTGTDLDGFQQGAAYGDDAQMNTNYPIVSVATEIGTTYFATTTDWNLDGVGVTNGATSVNFALPSGISQTPVVTAATLAPTYGQALNNVTVATFTDPNGNFATGDYAATIDWGDGIQSTGTVTGPVAGVYTVTGSHTYEEEGSLTLSVTIDDDYASGQLSVSASGISSAPTAFEVSGLSTSGLIVSGGSEATAANLNSSAPSSTYGDQVTFTATIGNVSGIAGVPTGSVEFYDGTTPIGPGTPMGGTGSTATWTFSTTTLDAGSHSIEAFFTASGPFADSYTFLSESINKAVLTVTGITAKNKVYDSTTNATVSVSGAHLLGLVNGDQLTFSGGTNGPTGTFASKDVGTNITVTVSGLSLSGPAAGNYTLTQPTTSANITPATLTVSGITVASKDYDSTTTATIFPQNAALQGVYSGDSVTLNLTRAVGTFATASAGTNITVTITGASLGGAQAFDYMLSSITETASISAAPLTVSGITGTNKVYNGTTADLLNTALATLAGVYSGDTVGLVTSGATGVFVTKSVGTGIPVSVTGLALTGPQAGDYSLTEPTTSANITPATLTVSGITAADKVYNGNTAAGLNKTNAALNGVVFGDSVSLVASGVVGTFATANVGNGITVAITGLKLSGPQEADYTLTQPTTTANITPAGLTVAGITALSKVYDASTAATLLTSGATLQGVVFGDTITLGTNTATGTFASPDVGTGISVAVSGLTVVGTNAGDYSLTEPTTTASITTASLTVSGVAAMDKVYNASTAATLDTTTASLVGVYSGDTVDLVSGTAVGAFVSDAVGTNIPVTVAGLSISGAQAGDYTLTQPTTAASITAATLTVSGITGINRMYNGSTAAALNTGSAALVGLYSGDSVTLNTGAAVGVFSSPGVATGIPITVTNLTIGGPQAPDYLLNLPTATANITPAPLSVSGVTAMNKMFDGTATATLNTSAAALVGVLNGDSVSLNTSGVTGTFASASVGLHIPVTVAGLTISGAQAADYTVTDPTTTAKITPSLSSVSVSDGGGTYDGATFGATALVTGLSGSGSSLEGIKPTLEYYSGQVATGSPLSGAPAAAGIYTVVAVFPGSADYQGSTSAPATFIVSQATASVSVMASGGAYSGSAFTGLATVAGLTRTPSTQLEGVPATPVYYMGTTATGTPLASAPVAAGTYTVVGSFPGSTDYAMNTSEPVTFTITKATPTVGVSVAGATYTASAYNATAIVTGISGPAAPELEGVAPTPVYYLGSTATGTPLGSAPVAAGTYTVVEDFPGSTDFVANTSAPATFMITKAMPSVSVSDPSGPYTGSAYNAAITVTGVGGQVGTTIDDVTATGAYYAGSTATGTPLASAPIDVGTYTVVANFSGSANYLSGNPVATTFIISKATPTLTVSAPSGTFTGAPAPVTVTVVGADNRPTNNLEGVAPTVNFYAGKGTSGPSLGSTPPTGVGTYTALASFAGSADYSPAQFSPVSFTIAPGSSSVALSSSLSSAVYGEAITFAANVTGSVTPTGAVTFSDNGKVLGTVDVNGSGTASLTTTDLALGGHSITATYNGNGSLLGSQSGPASASVSSARTSVVLVGNPILKKRKLKSEGLTAEIEPTAPGGGLPTGTATFELITTKKKKTKTRVLGTAEVSGGNATLIVKPKLVLKKVITVIYSGDTNFGGSTLTSLKINKKGKL